MQSYNPTYKQGQESSSLFPSPPSHSYHLAGPTEDQILDILLQKVQIEVLEEYDTLGLTQFGRDRLDEMIGVLGICQGPKAIKAQVCTFLCVNRRDGLTQWFFCSVIKYSNLRCRRRSKIRLHRKCSNLN
jgi:hypothetical protein